MLVLIMFALIAVALAVGSFEYVHWSRRMRAGDRAVSAQEAGPGEQRQLSLLTESLAYVGTLLILSGSFVATSLRWLHITNSERADILSAAALVLLVAGFVVRWAILPKTHRLTEVLWLASVASAAGAMAIATADVYGWAASGTVLAVSAMVAAYSAALWLLCRRELLMVVAFTGLVGALCSGIVVGAGSATPWLAVALGLLLFGVAWVILGWLYPRPLGTSVSLGAAIALAAPGIAVHEVGWVYAIGIAVAAAAMLTSIPLRNVVILAFGSCALFGYITAVVVRFADHALGVAYILILIGGLLIGLALVTVRLSQITRTRADNGTTPSRVADPSLP